MKDLFGKAILDYATNNAPKDLITETSISEADEMSVAYLFRPFAQMPAIEQRALQESKGRILDIGCGAGSHSLYLQNKGFDVTAIDISPNAIQACKLRGIEKAFVADIMQLENDKFDTILLLMNGAGMCGRLDNLGPFLLKLKSLLNAGGQVLLDSSDIIYMFDEDEDDGTRGEAKWMPTDGYYGNVTFYVSYKNEKEIPFEWLYVDFETLENAATGNGFKCEQLLAGPHYDYLARLSL